MGAEQVLLGVPSPLPAQPSRPRFTIVRGTGLPPVEDPRAVPAEEAGAAWEPHTFADLDAEIAWRSALAQHNRKVSEARLADAKALEEQIDDLLLRYAKLVPKPAQGKAWKASVGEFSGGTYRNQPVRAAQYELADKELARAKGLAREYVQLKPDTAAIKAWEQEHVSDAIPGVLRIEQGPVSFKPLGSKDEAE